MKPGVTFDTDGLISVVSNQIPAEMTELVRAANHNDFARARQLQRAWFPLMQINFVESNPMPVKWAMHRMGLLEPNFRLPMVQPSDSAKQKIEVVLRACGLLTPEAALARSN